MSDIFGTNLSFTAFDDLLKQDDLSEEPIPLERFVVDSKYLGLPALSEIQLEIGKHMTQIYKKETLQSYMGEQAGSDYYDKYTVNEVVAQLGKGSGKDHTSRVSFAYICYLLHCLRNPLKYYGKAHGVTIDLINLAVNAKQAQQVFFDPLKKLLMASPWALDAGFEPRVQEIHWFDKPVRLFSGHSESEGWEGYEVLVVVLDEIAAFKGLGPNVPVLTPNGWKKNGDLRVGDFVIGSDGKATEVLNIFPMGNKEVFEVTFEDGSTAQCSEDHIWNVNEYSDGRRKQNKDLQLKDFKSLRLPTGSKQYRYSVPVVDPVEFEQGPELPVDPYILGVLISEGGLTQSVKFSTKDDEIVENVQARLPDGYKVVHHKNADYAIVHDGISNEIKDAIKYLSLDVKSEDKFIPDIYLYSSIDDRKALLAGLMDGDGTVARGYGSYTTVSDRLKDDIVELCRNLGGVPMVSVHDSWYKDADGNRVECKNAWHISPRLPFNPFSLSRKANKWKPHKRSLWRTIVDVKSLGFEEEMTCIKVSNDNGLYVINDYIVTHNTDVELKGDMRNKGSASQIYNMSRISVASRFPAFGKVCLLSFPRFRGDFIQQRYDSVIQDLKEQGAVMLDEKFGNKGVERERKTWAVKAATWEVNPTRHKEEFEDEFRRDPVQSKARFMCEPPEMEDAYFRDPELIRNAFNKLDAPFNADGTFDKWFMGNDGYDRYIHIDLGQKRDRCSLAMVHSPGMKQVRIKDHVEYLPIVNMDLVYYWEGSQQHEVPFNEVRRMVIDLSKKFNIVSVTLDQWQSVDMIQSLRAQGINAEMHSVKKTDYDTFSTAIYDGRFRGYWNEILVNEELLKLKLINNTKVDHPTTGTKDLADSVVGATFMCISNFAADVDVEIEVWSDDDLDYDGLTSYESDARIDKMIRESEEKESVDVPDDVKDWLNLI